MSGNHEIPTSAPPPPGAALNHGLGQCCSSPTRRTMVTPSVITAGSPMSLAIETDFVSATESSPKASVLLSSRHNSQHITAATRLQDRETEPLLVGRP